MYDYETMSAWEALTLAKQASGLTTEEIARRSGISAHVLRRYFKPTDDGYLPSLERVLAESEASGITPVMARELRGLLEDVSREVRRAADMLRSLAAARGLAEAVPLFSLDEQRRAERPAWWRLFGRGGRHGG